MQTFFRTARAIIAIAGIAGSLYSIHLAGISLLSLVASAFMLAVAGIHIAIVRTIEDIYDMGGF